MHELTDKLALEIGQNHATWLRRDSIIRQWLKEKAVLILKNHEYGFLTRLDTVEKILGLPESEVKDGCDEHPNSGCGWGEIKSKYEEVIKPKEYEFRTASNTGDYRCPPHGVIHCPTCNKSEPLEDVKMKWCEHIKKDKYQDYRFMQGVHQYIVPDFWGICPVEGCYISRPKTQTLRDVLAKEFQLSIGTFASSWPESWSYTLADIAIQTIKEFKE